MVKAVVVKKAKVDDWVLKVLLMGRKPLFLWPNFRIPTFVF
jgi:hypothetical protein